MGNALEVDVATAKSWIDSGNATLIDVRERDEFAAEQVPGAELCPLSTFDPSSIARQGANAGKKILLMCRSGGRSINALARLKSVAAVDAYSVSGGITAWKNAGYDVKRLQKAPISIMRQVQIVAGTMVLTGIILGEFVSPWFRLLAAFFGAGLVFAGVSGTCGLAAVLSLMPWNRAVMRCVGK